MTELKGITYLPVSGERITKLDAARRQLETAIQLYFTGGDQLSTHTLAKAAFELLRGVNKARGGSPMAQELEFLPPDLRKQVIALQNEIDNFLKHADRDPAASIVFEGSRMEFLLAHSVHCWKQLEGSLTSLMTCYITWFHIKFSAVDPEIQSSPILSKVYQAFRSTWDEHSAQKFYADYIQSMRDRSG